MISTDPSESPVWTRSIPTALDASIPTVPSFGPDRFVAGPRRRRFEHRRLGLASLTRERPPERRHLVRETRANTDRPVGVNGLLDPTSTAIPTEAVLEVALEEGVDVVSFSFGSGAEFVARGHAHSGCAMQTVGSVAGATEAVEANADVVAAQVQEAGGHVESDVSPRPLVPRVADAIDDRPVVAAGGTVDR